MKGPIRRTKVVLRHLPPTISQSSLTEQIDGCFAGRYSWLSFSHGNNRKQHLSYSRGYIVFKRPEDVVEFVEFFDGHVLINEKGSQFKTIVEYAPSQRVPKQCSRRDGREGTINKDPEYMEFVEFISKPVDRLPSAEIQLERREAAGSAKDALIVTPLMEFVRQKRAGRSLPNGKTTIKTSGATSGNPEPFSSNQCAEKRRKSTTMYVLGNTTNVKEESTIILLPKRDDRQVCGNSISPAAASGTELLEDKNGISGTIYIGKKKILPLKEKEKQIPRVSGGLSLQHIATSTKNSLGSATLRPNQRYVATGRIINSILLNKDTHQTPSSSSSVVHSEQQIQPAILQKDKRPPRPPNSQLFHKDNKNGCPDDKRTRNKDRPDRGIWIPIRHLVGSHASELNKSLLDSAEGSHKHSGRHGPVHNDKDGDSTSKLNEGKPLKRGGSSGNGLHEKQVWVQKSSLRS